MIIVDADNAVFNFDNLVYIYVHENDNGIKTLKGICPNGDVVEIITTDPKKTIRDVYNALGNGRTFYKIEE